ncbi:kinase-like domain-containing protein [Phycomyces blakesleeanus]|uniref:Kinase-like domain-containing protein n=2 Tax=Phycomyces blakesleeanus TaxID=4837 RepID=A0ABR3B6Z6_PHYBL
MLDRIIDGNYQLLEELGRGSYGCLFLGQSLDTNQYVAVKVLSKAGLDTNQRTLQQLEIDIQSSLHHPYLLSIHQTTQDEDHIFMVMELCDQGDLFDFVIRDPLKLCDQSLVKTLFGQILQAIEHMHSNHVYHRDIKLENILLKCDDDDQYTCKVADFGLATRERLSLEFGCGSTTYLGPEHFDDEDNGDDEKEAEEFVPYDAAASDCWSLGILLIALMFGRNPWEEATTMDPSYAEYIRDPLMLAHLFPTLSNGCLDFLISVLDVRPQDRPSVSAMRAAFMALENLFEEEEFDDDLAPITIPTALKTQKASFDSAIFSGGAGYASGSWSDMVDEESEPLDYDPFESPLASSCTSLEEDTDMFVHSQEKESWWL